MHAPNNHRMVAAEWRYLFALAFLCTALGYLLYFPILATAGATNLLLVTLLMPPGTLLLGSGASGRADRRR